MNMCDDLIRKTLFYLPNESVFNMKSVNHRIKYILDDPLIKHRIIYRWHPMVFNFIDNFCTTCNLKMVRYCDRIIRCNHL